MTKEQMITIMEYFQIAYKGFYEDKDIRSVLSVWYDIFGEEDEKIVKIAARNYVKKNVFPPTIAGLQEQIDMLKEQQTDVGMWSMLQKAVSNSLYHADEEFKKLPPECQSFVGSPSALKDLAQTDVGTMNTVVKGQFLKRVNDIKEHREVQNGLPVEVKKVIEENKMLDVLFGM